MKQQRDKDVAMLHLMYKTNMTYSVQDLLQRAWELGHHAGMYENSDEAIQKDEEEFHGDTGRKFL